MSNNTNYISARQELNLIKCSNLDSLLNKLSVRATKLFFLLNSLSEVYDTVYPCQSTLALTLGVNRWIIAQCTDELEKAGLITVERLGKRINLRYYIDPVFKTKKGKKKLSMFRKCSLFALSFLTVSASQNKSNIDPLTLYKGRYTQTSGYTPSYSLTPHEIYLKTSHQGQLPQRFATKGETYDRIGGQTAPNKRMSLQDWDVILSPPQKRIDCMSLFTEEQLLEFTKYPKDVLDKASKKLTNDMHSGKVIHNHFKYFSAMCDALIEQAKIPKPEYGRSSTSVGAKPVEWKPKVREKLCVKQELRNYLQEMRDVKDASQFKKDILKMGLEAHIGFVVDEYGEQVATDIVNEFNSI